MTLRIFRVLSKIPPRPRFQSKQYNKSSRYQNKPEGMLAGEDTTKLIPNISLIYRLLILPSLPFPQGDLTGIIVYLCLSLQALQIYWSSSSACVVSFNSSQCLDAAATFLCSFLIQFNVFFLSGCSSSGWQIELLHCSQRKADWSLTVINSFTDGRTLNWKGNKKRS